MRRTIGGCMGLACVVATAPARGEDAATRHYDLPSQPLATALAAVARSTGRTVVADAALVRGLVAPPLRGRFGIADALRHLLAGSKLHAEAAGQGFVVRATDAPRRELADEDPGATNDIVVTGSRIRGAPVAASVIVRTAETIRDEGQATLADVARTISQNFGGGQNPGIGANVPAASGVNVGGGASLNLRGLGSDATLTLLNGRRLAYGASRQSVDISAIPMIAVDRIEIIADGASALYGSDAIAGVANIKLRRDMAGVTTTVRIGASTEGGNVEQVHGVATGGRWSGGGMIAAYEFGRNTVIRATDRDYARARVPGLDLYPALRRHSVAFSGHQAIAPQVSIAVDMLYNHRDSLSQIPLTVAGVVPSRFARQPSDSSTWTLAPSLLWSPGAWQVGLAGSVGRDRTHYATNQFTGNQLTSRTFGCYCNEAEAIELSGDGPLFNLPGGAAKIALGVGVRNNRLVSLRGDNPAQDIDAHQASRYAYVEASLPLVAPAQAIAGIDRLAASAALRREDYGTIGAMTTPKLGLIYAPLPGLELKASWGQSFRAPTLFQRYQPLVVAVLPAATFGGTGLPSTASAFYLSGGRETLRPERAESWSMTLAIHPRALPGLTIEAGYFETRYRDRIVAPITFIARALADPSYAAQVTRAPASAVLADLRSSAGQFLNATGRPYDAANVVAVIDNANVNAGRQAVRGVDLSARFDQSLGSGTLHASGNLGYLESEQQLTPSQPVVALAGAIFNPPHLRGRATLGWTQRKLTVTAAVTHVGSVEDRRFAPAPRVAGMDMADLTLRYRTGPGSAWWNSLDIVLTAQNILDAEPASIRTSLPYDTPYDSTNYTPFGRFVALSASKSW